MKATWVLIILFDSIVNPGKPTIFAFAYSNAAACNFQAEYISTKKPFDDNTIKTTKVECHPITDVNINLRKLSE